MRPGQLSIDQIIKLQREKNKGKKTQELMEKYGIGKTSFFKYAKMDIDKKPKKVIEEEPEEEYEEEPEEDIVVLSESEDEVESDDDTGILSSGEFDDIVDTDIVTLVNEDDYLNDFRKNMDQPKSKKETDPKPKKQHAPKMSKMPKLKAAKRPSTRKPKVPLQLSEEEKAEQDKLITKIMNYTETFRDKLANYLPIKGDKYGRYITGLYKKTPQELTAELEFVRSKLSVTSSKTAFHLMYNTGTTALEHLGSTVGLNLKGLSDETQRSKDIDQALAELSCEHSFDKYLDPKLRLMGLTGFAILKVDSMNKRRDLVSRAQPTVDLSKEHVAEDLLEKYQEI